MHLAHKISVIVPVHNSQRTLDECLHSLFETSYNNFEVIIVDDCSIDKSIEIAKKYPCKIISFPEQRGPAYARDKGQLASSGEIVAFLDSDCIAPRDWLDKIEAKLTLDIIGIGGRYVLPETIGIIPALFIISWDFKNFFYTKPRGLLSLSGGNCAFWKSVLEQKRRKLELLYCNRMVGGDDTIMCCELSKFKKPVYDPDLYVIHNKEYSLFNIARETINLGYGGAVVTKLFGRLLIKEPHRLYKTILYFASLFLFFTGFLLLLKGAWAALSAFLFLYIALQLPMIILLGKHVKGKTYILFFPIVTFALNLFHFIGHAQRAFYLIKRATKFIAWHIKVILTVINPSALFRIFLFVTKKCNASCYFCFNKGAIQAPQGVDLSLDEIKKIARKMPFLPWLTISGGEPFLRKDIYDICRLFHSSCGTRIISIVTNGTSPSYIEEVLEKILTDCEALYLTVIVALDDIGEKHDQIKGIKGCYEQATETLGRLNILQLRFPRLTLGINTMIIKDNSKRIEEILDYFSNNFSFNRQYLNLPRKPPSVNIDQELISIQRYLDLVKLKTCQAKSAKDSSWVRQKFDHSLLDYISRNTQETLRSGRSQNTCLAAKKLFVVDNNGDVFACEPLNEKLGNLRDIDYDIRKIIRNSKVKNIRRMIKNTRCYCLWPCATATNTYLKVSSYPKIILRMITNSIFPCKN